jgi:hypothetical protein
MDGALTGIAPIRPLQLYADGGYQLRLGVLGVPLITVPDNPTPKNQPDGAAPFPARSHSHGRSLHVVMNFSDSSTKQRMEPLYSSSLCNQTKNRAAPFQLTKHRTERLRS